MASKECVPRVEAMKEVFRKNYDILRGELQHEINTLNSNLYSKELISGDVMMKVDIDIMLSAIRGRLDNADVAENTFTGFCDAVADIASKKHLKLMLLKSLREELKEEAVYATPSIPEQFYCSAITNLPDVPSRLAQPRTIWQEKSDSALTSSEFIDEEFPPRQATNENKGSHIIVRTASGTIPELSPHGQNLERRVHELEDRIKQLKREKKESQRLARDKISDTNRQLEEALGC